MSPFAVQNRRCHTLSSITIPLPTCVLLFIPPSLSHGLSFLIPRHLEAEIFTLYVQGEHGLTECENQTVPEEHQIQLLLKWVRKEPQARESKPSFSMCTQIWASGYACSLWNLSLRSPMSSWPHHGTFGGSTMMRFPAYPSTSPTSLLCSKQAKYCGPWPLLCFHVRLSWTMNALEWV